MNIFIDSGSAGGGTDPYFANVSLLLHFNGTNGSTTFTDSSSIGHTLTATSDAALSTTGPKFGTACYLSSSGYASIPAHSSLDLGTGDFTVEGFAYTGVPGQLRVLYSHDTAGGNRRGPFVHTNGSGGIRGFCGTTPGDTLFGDTLGGGTVPTSTWFHWAYVRNGTTFTMFLDGTSVGTPATSSASCVGGEDVQIGRYRSAGLNWIGRIDEVRLTKGVARYTSNFTPPSAEFPDA